MKVLAAPTALHDIEYDEKKEYTDNRSYKVKISRCPRNLQLIGSYLQGERRQYGLKHQVIPTIHVCMGDTLDKVALKMTDQMFELQDKGQIIVALSRTKIGRNTIFIGNKENI